MTTSLLEKLEESNKRLNKKVAELEAKEAKLSLKIKECVEYYAPQVKALREKVGELQDYIKNDMSKETK